jgi:ATP phosphoribosyltransferase regulatory subunit
MAPALLEAGRAWPARSPRLARALDRKDAAPRDHAPSRPGPLRCRAARAAGRRRPRGRGAGRAGRRRPAAGGARDRRQRRGGHRRHPRARAGLRITLDPVEFRGFRYHVGVAFTLYGPGARGAGARRPLPLGDGAGDGHDLYPDAVLRGAAPRRGPRVFRRSAADRGGAALRGRASPPSRRPRRQPQRRALHAILRTAAPAAAATSARTSRWPMSP